MGNPYGDGYVGSGTFLITGAPVPPNKPVSPEPSNEGIDIKLGWPTLTWEAG